MKIKQIYDVLKDNVDKLHLVTETDNNNYTNVTNVQSVANALRNIGQLGTLVSLEKFKTAHAQFYSLHEDNYTTFSNNITPLKVQIHAIKSEAQSLINTLETLLPEEDGFILSVKLPEYEALDKLPKFYNNLDSTFSPLVMYFGLDDTLEILNLFLYKS